MQYNTQQKRMALPEYGRSIQNMVDYAVTIPDRAERQRCANTIINIMGNLFPHLRDVPDFKHKLWDHLAIMSDFKLDIDYPIEIIRKERLDAKPEPIPYPRTRIRYRHYGRSLEVLIKKACEMPEGEEKRQLTALICNHMKKDYMAWNKDTGRAVRGTPASHARHPPRDGRAHQPLLPPRQRQLPQQQPQQQPQ